MSDDLLTQAAIGTRDREARRVQRLEARISELRAVEYPTESEMRELERSRVEAGEINKALGR